MLDLEEVRIHLHKAYNALLLGRKASYKWKGPLLTTKKILVCCPNVDRQFEAESIKEQKDQGRTKVDVILMAAVQLGIQQGINIANEDYKLLVDRMETNSDRIMYLVQHFKKDPSKQFDLEMIESFARDMKEVAQRRKEKPL